MYFQIANKQKNFQRQNWIALHNEYSCYSVSIQTPCSIFRAKVAIPDQCIDLFRCDNGKLIYNVVLQKGT